MQLGTSTVDALDEDTLANESDRELGEPALEDTEDTDELRLDGDLEALMDEVDGLESEEGLDDADWLDSEEGLEEADRLESDDALADDALTDDALTLDELDPPQHPHPAMIELLGI